MVSFQLANRFTALEKFRSPAFTRPKVEEMIKRSTIVLMLLPFGSLFADDSIDPSDIHDEVKVGNVVFLFRRDKVHEKTQSNTKLEDVLPVADVLLKAQPNPETRDLLDFALGHHHELEFERLVMINPGGSNFQFGVTSRLIPKPGGITGIPWTFRSWIRGNGEPITPDVYFESVWDLDGESERFLRCLLPMARVRESIGKAELVGDEIQKIATDSLERVLPGDSKHNRNYPPFRFHAQTLKENLPGGLKVWEVAFIDSVIAAEPDLNSYNRFKVWVTIDGKCGAISIGPETLSSASCERF